MISELLMLVGGVMEQLVELVGTTPDVLCHLALADQTLVVVAVADVADVAWDPGWEVFVGC
jgi:phenylpyruvate tautomerase PptA (4-oxalocrotonate tautomerase family)